MIEIGGHTDNTGTAKVTTPLSQARADSVLSHLRTNFPGMNAAQYSARGYGPDRPIAPNTSALGRAKNRRVEFKVTNTEALRIERERRRFLRRDESTPPVAPPSPEIPTTIPSDTTTTAPPDTTKR